LLGYSAGRAAEIHMPPAPRRENGPERTSEDWYRGFDEWESEPEQLLAFGQGVVFALVRWDGRPAGGTGSTRARGGLVFELAGATIVRVTVYTRDGIHEARAAAERLAESGR
jgi:hypothetical protein